MKNKLNKIADYIGQLILIMAIFVVAFFAASRILPNFRYGLFIIQSGSMEPTIKTGSVAVDKKVDDYKERDIITFRRTKQIITHRITKIVEQNGEKLYQTKGDANNGEDMILVRKNDVLGKVIFSIPFLGYIMAFAKTKLGIFLLIVLPALWIIGQEVAKIKKNLKEKNADKEI